MTNCVVAALIAAIPIMLARTVEIHCPSHCRCDIFKTYKRANCTHQKLVIAEAFLPDQTELLDLSYNQISHLEDHTFFEQKLLSLKLLNISHNKISDVHMNAFVGLNHLKTLDLSFNAMQYILTNWFWHLLALEELYMRGNNFGQLTNHPLIESNSLQVLDLSKCTISNVDVDALTKIPNVQLLDLSDNNLIQVNSAAVSPLKRLKRLKLAGNTFACNGVTAALAAYCRKSAVAYDDPCIRHTTTTNNNNNNNNNNNKFERIIDARTVGHEMNGWIYEEEPPSGNITMSQQCPNATATATATATTTTTTTGPDDLFMRIIKLSPRLAILIPFVYGICIGLAIGCSVQIRPKISPLSNAENTYRHFDDLTDTHWRRTNNPFTIGSSDYEATESLMMSEWNIYQSTPLAQRKLP